MHAAPFDAEPSDRHAGIAQELATQGWSVRDDLLDKETVRHLAREAWAEWQEGGFRQARVGTGTARQLRPEIRSDHVRWLDPETPSQAQRRYFDLIVEMRQSINRNLMMGLETFEAHFAVFPPQAFYAKHLDQFVGAHQRAVSTILYLNEDWGPDDGGALRLDLDDGDAHIDLLPIAGRIVNFLSAQCVHQVLPAERHRLSLTGWHRVRPLAGER